MPSRSHAEIIPTLSLILVSAIKTAGEKKKKWWNTPKEKEHLNWSGYLYSNPFMPRHFLTKSDATPPKSQKILFALCSLWLIVRKSLHLCKISSKLHIDTEPGVSWKRNDLTLFPAWRLALMWSSGDHAACRTTVWSPRVWRPAAGAGGRRPRGTGGAPRRGDLGRKLCGAQNHPVSPGSPGVPAMLWRSLPPWLRCSPEPLTSGQW